MEIQTVLVVDEDTDTCEGLVLLWSSYGLTVHTCRNLREARKLAPAIKAQAILLSDAGTKDGIAGFLKELRKKKRKLKFVSLITGEPMLQVEATTLVAEAGADGWVEKPIAAMATLKRLRLIGCQK